ncbi:MAG TPA: UbiA family prenyltransferase [Ohtaekwangia sp.]|nr:UbiA family prenyltransferase [Ohtaekwangia sp.]
MFSRSSLLHLRILFSYFLLPIFLFSLSLSPNIQREPLLWTFIIIHLFLYPASNAFNSYFDKDENSIGLLKRPPRVKKGLYYLALLFDIVAILLGYFFIGLTFAIMLLVYGLVSKAYSHTSVRLKKYAIISWIVTGLFQGIFTFIMCYIGINMFGIGTIWKAELLLGGLLTSLMLWANYPLTQVYQHEEDAKRGDNTFSMLLGIRGTFYFAAVMFGIATLGFIFYFNTFFDSRYSFAFVLALTPVVSFFLYWFWKVYQHPAKADYKHTMWLNFISATCLNVFFIYLFFESTHILNAFG